MTLVFTILRYMLRSSELVIAGYRNPDPESPQELFG